MNLRQLAARAELDAIIIHDAHAHAEMIGQRFVVPDFGLHPEAEAFAQLCRQGLGQRLAAVREPVARCDPAHKFFRVFIQRYKSAAQFLR